MLTAKIDEPIVVFLRRDKLPRKLFESHTHIEGFCNLVKYIVRLRRDGTIDDEMFEELVKRASALFVESEISEKIERVLENKSNDYLKNKSNDYLMSLLK